MTVQQRNIMLTISYDGTSFSGWQKQLNSRTIQGEIERCLSIMTCEAVTLHGAGRTDAGVHAEAMTAHFTTRSKISSTAFQQGLNSMLESSIRILSARQVPDSFHSRFSARAKEYHYHIYTGQIHPPLARHYSYHFNYPLNIEAISECLKAVTGTHDFSSFENAGTRDKTITTGRGAVRTIFQAELVTTGKNEFYLKFIGDGFLRNMVRNLAGTILEVSRGKLSLQAFRDILEAKDRSSAGPTAPAHGLRLKKVFYDPVFEQT